MPELPDVEVYLEALREFVVGHTLLGVQVRSPGLLRSVEPPLGAAAGKRVEGVRRIGKRVVLDLEGGVSLVVHLMIAGRFHWKKAGVKPAGKNDLAAFSFAHGTLVLTEASQKKRASLHVARSAEVVAAFDRGGLDVLAADLPAFAAALRRENRTLKRALTDPRIMDGIGNAFSDEILHAARLSPLTWTSRLDEGAIARLHAATQDTLTAWLARLRAQRGGKFPEKVTAFRPEMAVHGKHGQPCPVCGATVQRISYADNETNYCPPCQTEGKLLADRALSKLLRGDWPKTLEELESLKAHHAQLAGTEPDGLRR